MAEERLSWEQRKEKIREGWASLSREELWEKIREEWRIAEEDLKISITGAHGEKVSAPLPMRSWEESSLEAELLEAVEAAGYESPTPIQMAAIPIGLENMNALVVAKDGSASGKTAAFVLPMLSSVSELKRRYPPRPGRPFGLVLTPTRERAKHVEAEAAKFSAAAGVRVVRVEGGNGVREPVKNVDPGTVFDVVIGTPHQLVECLWDGLMALKRCGYVVVDGADRIMDMHIECGVGKIVDLAHDAERSRGTWEVEDEVDHFCSYSTRI